MYTVTHASVLWHCDININRKGLKINVSYSLSHRYLFFLNPFAYKDVTLSYKGLLRCPDRDLHCKGEAKKKEHGGQKEGRSAGDSCQSFRRFSRRILSATPRARIRIRTESQRDRTPADFEYASALGNAKFCCSGSSHCSVLCNYTTYNPPPLCSFFQSALLFFLHPPYSFVGDGSCCPMCLSPCRGRRLRSRSRFRVSLLPSLFDLCLVSSMTFLLASRWPSTSWS